MTRTPRRLRNLARQLHDQYARGRMAGLGLPAPTAAFLAAQWAMLDGTERHTWIGRAADFIREHVGGEHMPLVAVETPYAGDVEGNVAYAREALLDCLNRGEAPLASHLLYPQVLDDLDPDDRSLGIEAGLQWSVKADLTVVYFDRGISPGMKMAIARAEAEHRPVEFRSLEGAPPPDGGTVG